MNQSENKICQNCKRDFIIEPDDFSFYEKIQVPPPTFCPKCRKQRRLSWRNDTNLYSRKCSLCDKSVISIYAPNGEMTVYCQKCWWSDGWDAKEYAQDYDFSRPFFDQYKELLKKVPILTMINDNGIASVGCEYTHDFSFGKDCYMTFVAWKVENCLYNYYMINGKDIVDALYSMGDCFFTYETVHTEKCYQCRYIYYSSSLVDCAFCYDCRDCSNCFLSVGLRHKQYYFKNKQYSKEEYEKIIKEYRLDTYSGVERAKKEFQETFYKSPRKFANLRNCVNCLGDNLINGKNSQYCFNVQRAENCKWVENADTPKDCYDLSTGGELEQCYEGVTPDHSSQSKFAIFSWKNNNVDYVDGCHSSKYLFGCSGLKKSQYCILNKQCSKEEYEELIPRIKKHMDEMPYVDGGGIIYKYGEFFPSELSYFKYNETNAQDLFPLKEEDIENKGLQWQDKFQLTSGKETIKSEDIPDGITDVSDSITKEVLSCVQCNRNYKVIDAEMIFYRRMKIPIPRKCFYCRHKERFALHRPSRLWHRKCQCIGSTNDKRPTTNDAYKNTVTHFHGAEKCPNEFETSYSPDRKEIVYCEACYNAEIV